MSREAANKNRYLAAGHDLDYVDQIAKFNNTGLLHPDRQCKKCKRTAKKVLYDISDSFWTNGHKENNHGTPVKGCANCQLLELPSPEEIVLLKELYHQRLIKEVPEEARKQKIKELREEIYSFSVEGITI